MLKGCENKMSIQFDTLLLNKSFCWYLRNVFYQKFTSTSFILIMHGLHILLQSFLLVLIFKTCNRFPIINQFCVIQYSNL